MSLLLLACNSKEDQLKKQLSGLEAELPKVEKQQSQAQHSFDSIQDAMHGVTAAQYAAAMGSEDYKAASMTAAQASMKVDSLKKAIADTKEKILLEK